MTTREELLRRTAVFEQLGDSIACYERDGTIVYVNPITCAMFGRSRDELVGSCLWALFPSAVGNPFHDAFDRVAHSGSSEKQEHFYAPWEKWFVNEITRADGLVWVVARDVTTEKQALAELQVVAREAEAGRQRLALLSEASDRVARTQHSEPELLAALVKVVGDHFGDACGVTLLDDDGSLRLAANYHPDPAMKAACETVFGAPLPAGTGISHQALATHAPVLVARVDHAQLRERAATPAHADFADRHRLRSVVAAPLHAGHIPVGVLTLSRFGDDRASYTQRDADLVIEIAGRAAVAVVSARQAQATEAMVVQLRDADRAKDEFLAILGHELRNPLAPLVTALDLAALRDQPPSPKTLSTMRRQVEHLQRLVDDLLDVAKSARGKLALDRRIVDIADMISRGVEMASPLLDQKRHRVIIDRGHVSSATVDGDPARLAQVFANLLTNAAKYTDPDGEIIVSISVQDKTVVVDVEDNGIGIADELLPRVFDMFVQAPQSSARRVGGLGLGLALVRNLVDLHGGSVAARSEGPGRGSTFSVRLPLAAPALRPRGEVPFAGQHAPRRVLLVDDNPDAVDMLAELVAEAGHEVCVAYDGVQALAMSAEFAPSIAVLDLGLPGMDGYELAKALRARLPTIRLIALTGYGHDTDRARSRDAGFHDHLVKPVSPSTLLRAINDPGAEALTR